MEISRRALLAAVGTTALAGCSSGSPTPTATAPATEPPASQDQTDEGTATPGTGDSAIPAADARLPLPLSPAELRERARSGGPPKDGIPSVDDPTFAPPESIDFLRDRDIVFGVVGADGAKAYPQKILVSHEIVNDTIAGTPVSVTYCPLTGTVQGFERGGTTFGVSGRLINNNLVMYDRETEAWWPQILATSIPGPWNGDPPIRTLREFRLVWTTWERWRSFEPDTSVLTMDTGYAINYERDPYGSYTPRVGYYENDRLLFPALDWDDRFAAKRVVMGARTPDGAVAVPKDSLRERGLVSGQLGETQILAVYDERLDTGYVYHNPDGRPFERADGMVRSNDGTTHQPDSLPLERIHTFDAMWFAWSGYYPDTTVL